MYKVYFDSFSSSSYQLKLGMPSWILNQKEKGTFISKIKKWKGSAIYLSIVYVAKE